MNQRFTSIILLLLTTGLLGTVRAQVSNVRLQQLDSLIRVTYDLKGMKSPTQVRVYFVTATGDTLRPTKLRGRVGAGVKPGDDRRITWNLAAERATINTELEAVVVAEYPPRLVGSGGPVYALLSLAAPGIGNIFVNPKRRIGLRPALTVACYGLIGYGLSQKSQANRAYDRYRNSLREEAGQPFYADANAAHHRYYIATRLGAALWATDVAATLIRGVRNQQQSRLTTYALPGLGRTSPAMVGVRYQF
ncbi:MAG: hypothetical protein LH606_12495 [Cytophagaceae bacterium]|nr:hypothetical protein [Cytophagaceae bacterium]